MTDCEQFRFAITVDSFNALESPQPCKNIFLQEAMIERPEAVGKALNAELDVFDRKECWKPILEQSLTNQQQALIISQGNTWKEKVDADGVPIKDNIRNVIHSWNGP